MQFVHTCRGVPADDDVIDVETFYGCLLFFTILSEHNVDIPFTF